MIVTDRAAKVEYLNQYRWMQIEIDSEEKRLSAIEDRLTGLPAKVITDMPRGGQPTTIDTLIAEKLELIEKINDKAVKMRAIKYSIEAMDDPRDREVLKLRFVDGITIERASERVGYSPRQFIRYVDFALEKYEIPKDVIL